MGDPIHVAVTRTVKPGCEAAFEDAIRAFFVTSMGEISTLGAQLLRPLPGRNDRTYGILRSFASEKERDAFYASEHFRRWEETVGPLVEEGYSRRSLHGLEAFFERTGSERPPPRWKMAVLTWLGVWPTVYFVSAGVAGLLQGWSRWAATGVVTLLVVLVLAWGVMPLMTRCFRPWLSNPAAAETASE
ncbi:MAG: antibiotic biosynthesis monooxygenase [Deltaproteobacteria bacterium]|nr:antibiotic biosynthesis monooxygenase [Deltaproteobacteria bacterium]